MRYIAIAAILWGGTLAADADPLQFSRLYWFDSPQISVIAAVQIGPSAGIAVRQGSAVNIFRASQIAPVSYADVTQMGYVNRATIMQIATGQPFVGAFQ